MVKMAASGSRGLVDVTNFTDGRPMVANILPMVTNISPMVTDVYLIVTNVYTRLTNL
jgi:hypothetical protein